MKIKISDALLETKFKFLLYDFSEVYWKILTPEAYEKFIKKDESFNETQLGDLRGFLNDLLEDVESENKK